jgi:hypothetical protein
MTHLEQQDLVKRLRIKADMITQGEKIAWGSDSALMHEAANALEATYKSAIEECVRVVESYCPDQYDTMPTDCERETNHVLRTIITTLKASPGQRLKALLHDEAAMLEIAKQAAADQATTLKADK